MSIAILMNMGFSFSDTLLPLCSRVRESRYSTAPALLSWLIGSSQRRLEGRVTDLPLAMLYYGLRMW